VVATLSSMQMNRETLVQEHHNNPHHLHHLQEYTLENGKLYFVYNMFFLSIALQVV
jgi:hypothetical protein